MFNIRKPGYQSRVAGLLMLLIVAPSATALAPGADGVKLTIPVSGVSDSAQAVARDPNGNIVLAGSDGGNSSVLVRLTPAGALDLSFGINGIAINDLDVNRGDALRALVSLDDGRYLGCGSFTSSSTSYDFFVARFSHNGFVDTGFGAGGVAVTAFTGASQTANDQCNALAVQTDGLIVAAGVTSVGHSHVALVRYTSSGALDPNFGTGGKLDINAAALVNGDSEARAIVLQPDGKLLIAGYAFGPGNSELLVMRLNGADGSPDLSFGTAGITRTPVGSSDDIANAMVLQPDGRVVVAGSMIAANGRNFVLARYTSNGVLDPSFGNGGLVTTTIGPSDAIAFALSLMPWGRLVAAGSARIDTSTSGTDLAVVAYNADGSLDHYFGVGGKRMLNISAFNDTVYGLANDISGARLWAVGTAYGSLTTAQDFLAVEFGLPDTIFRHDFETGSTP
jgi:uncharacterized delta-60 repeat protein